MSSAFVAAMDRQAKMDAGKHLGEKNAPEFTVCSEGGPDLVALFFKLVRGLEEAPLEDLMGKIWTKSGGLAAGASISDLSDLVVLTFQTRATRGMGKGEKSLFFQMLKRLPDEAVLATLPLVPRYGYYKDWLLFIEAGCSAPLEKKCLELYAEQLRADEAELRKVSSTTPKLSLAGKWAPREGRHFDKKGLRLAKKLAGKLFGNTNPAGAARKYRQLIAKLNHALCTTEVLMAAHKWEEIQFARVASLCLQRNRKAFLNEEVNGSDIRHPKDAGRMAAREHLSKALLEKGLKGKQLQPHEISRKCTGRLSELEAQLMDAQWKSMRQGVVEVLRQAAEERDKVAAEAALCAKDGNMDTDAAKSSLHTTSLDLKKTLPSAKRMDLGKLVPLVDVSGSMCGIPIEVAIGLGILISELNHKVFRDRVITFDSMPTWVDLAGCSSIVEKVNHLRESPWGCSTNFERACDLILGVVKDAKLLPDEIPDMIVFSDMQFDQAHESKGSWETHHERIQRKFAEVGVDICGQPYPAPRIIYWNLRSDTTGFPVQSDTPNTQMISGFSPSLLKLVLSGADLVADEREVVDEYGNTTIVREGPNPLATVRAALDDSSFDAVRFALSTIDNGLLAGYVYGESNEDGFAVID